MFLSLWVIVLGIIVIVTIVYIVKGMLLTGNCRKIFDDKIKKKERTEEAVKK